MCQVNTFMFKSNELDGEKLLEIVKIFQEAGFEDFCEYTNPNLRNIRRDLRLFQCGNICDCGSVVTKKVVVNEEMESNESKKLTEIITKSLEIVGTAYLFSHWYKNNIGLCKEKVNLERASHRVKLEDLNEDTYRDMFYNEVLEVSK